MSNFPPPRKRGRSQVSTEEYADLDRKFKEIAPATIKILQDHAQDVLKTGDKEIVDLYIKYVYKAYCDDVSGDEQETPEYLDQIGKNIGYLYYDLHPTSPFVYPFVSCLSRDVPVGKFEKFTGISRTTVWRSNQDTDNSIFQMPTNINRSGPTKFTDEEKERVVVWIKNICPVPSGSKYDKHYQYMSNKDLYLKYSGSQEDDTNPPLIDKATFFRVRKTINIRAVFFDFTCFCPYCNESESDLIVDEDDDEDDPQPNQPSTKKTKEEHLELKTVQYDAFQRIRSSLGVDEVLLVMDFTSAAIPHAKSQSLFVNDLIFTLYDADQQHDWVNYISTSDNKQMYAYVEGSLFDFISTYIPHNVQRIYVFSDGGPHHFKIWKTVNLFHYLAKMFEISMEYHFFESYHGSSLCDAHAGHVKKAIRYLIRDGTKITTLDELMPKLKRLDLKNATFEVMKLLETTLIETLKKVPALKKLYKFVYDGKTIQMFAKSSDSVPVKQIKF
jgi:hypothetical protein